MVSSLGPPKLNIHCRRRRIHVWGLAKEVEASVDDLHEYFVRYGRRTHLAVFYEHKTLCKPPPKERRAKTVASSSSNSSSGSSTASSSTSSPSPPPRPLVPVRSECVSLASKEVEDFVVHLLQFRRLKLFKESSLSSASSSSSVLTPSQRPSSLSLLSSSSSTSSSAYESGHGDLSTQVAAALAQWDLSKDDITQSAATSIVQVRAPAQVYLRALKNDRFAYAYAYWARWKCVRVLQAALNLRI